MISSFLSDDRNRHLYAARRRRAMASVISDGGDPASFEILQWIRNCAREIVGILHERAHEYDGKFPWDKATRHDIKDALDTAIGMLRS